MWLVAYVSLLVSLRVSTINCQSSVRNSTGNEVRSVDDNNSCKMLPIHHFQLDLSCILQAKAHSVVHKLRAPSLAKCKQVCCDYWEGPCDMVYWNNRHECFVMNYYVLSFCSLVSLSYTNPLYSPSTLLLSVSNRVPSALKKVLLNGYRRKVQELLGCGSDQFVCDDWSCISQRYYCDETVHCSDGSDENQCNHSGLRQCLGFDGKFYDPGEEYTPFDVQDTCKKCICGNNSSPLYCYSALCDPNLLSLCQEPSDDICCRCHMSGPLPDETSDLSTSQRLIVSCLAVIAAISLLLYFSGNLTERARRAVRNDATSDNGEEAARSWYPSDPRGCPRNRSFFSRYLSQNQSVSFFDQDGLPAVYLDVPPPYSAVKPITPAERATVEVDPPPSYPVGPSRNEAPASAASDNQSEDLPTMQQINQGASTSQPITRQYSDNEPVSPLSTTSESPLLQNNAETSNVTT